MARLSATRWRSYLLLGINTLVWGAAFIVVKPAFAVTTPFRFLFYRYLIASLAILPTLVILWPKFKQRVAVKKRFNKVRQIIALEILGNGIALAVLYLGLNLTSSLEANLIATTVPIFVTLGGLLFLKEKVEKHEFKGLIIAFVGTIFLTFIPFFGLNSQFARLSIWGNLLIILHNIANIFYFPLAKKAYQGLPKLFVGGVSFLVSVTFFALLSAWELHFPGLSFLVQTAKNELTQMVVLWPAFYMAIFGSIIGLTVYIKGQEGIEASEASWFWYLQPLVYIPLGMLVLREQISFVQILALAIILIGVYLAEKRK